MGVSLQVQVAASKETPQTSMISYPGRRYPPYRLYGINGAACQWVSQGGYKNLFGTIEIQSLVVRVQV